MCVYIRFSHAILMLFRSVNCLVSVEHFVRRKACQLYARKLNQKVFISRYMWTILNTYINSIMSYITLSGCAYNILQLSSPMSGHVSVFVWRLEASLEHITTFHIHTVRLQMANWSYRHSMIFHYIICQQKQSTHSNVKCCYIFVSKL